MFRSAALTLTLYLATITAHAALVSRDLFSQGDGLTTLDTQTSLLWLDVTQSVNYSYLDIVNGVGNSFLNDGWRYATEEEVRTLFATNLPGLTTSNLDPNVYQSFVPGDFYAEMQPDVNGEAFNLNALFGSLGFVWNYTDANDSSIAVYSPLGFEAVYGRETVGGHSMAAVLYRQDNGEVFVTQAGGAQDTFRSTNSANKLGHLLVQMAVVPVAQSVWLFGSALGLMGLIRRKQTNV